MVVKSIYNATPDSDDYETDCVKTKELIISFREDVFSSVIHVAYPQQLQWNYYTQYGFIALTRKRYNVYNLVVTVMYATFLIVKLYIITYTVIVNSDALIAITHKLLLI